MKFKTVENPEINAPREWNYGGSHIKESENYLLLIQPVLYGWRVKLIKKNSYYYDLDLCAGKDIALIQVLYVLVETILTQFKEPYLQEFLSTFPTMKSRPYHTDPSYIPQLMELILEETDFIATDISEKELLEGRKRSFNPITN